MSGIGVTGGAQVEIISAWTMSNEIVLAVAADPGWYVKGSFKPNVSTDEARLQLIGSVSDASLTLKVRIFDITAGAPVDGTLIQLSSLVDVEAVSAVFPLVGGRTYQVQAEVVGNAGDAYFGVMRSATLI